MSRMTLSRVGLVLILATVLSLASRPSWAGTGHASRPQPTPASSSVSLLGQAWHHLVSVFGRVGSAIDPNGISFASHNAPPTTPVGTSSN